MAKINQPEIVDDVVVTKATIMELIHPPISDSAFHKWVKDGKIIRARIGQGFYLLNKTRRSLGLPPVDVKKFRMAAEKIPTVQRRMWLMYFAARELVPEIQVAPPTHEMPGAFTDEDMAMFEDMKVDIADRLTIWRDDSHHLPYLAGMLDSMELLDKFLAR